MAVIKSFKALKFNMENAEIKGKIAELTCPPYDIISEEERKSFIGKNPYNIIRLELPRSSGNDRGEKDQYEEAGELLSTWMQKGVLKYDDEPGIYIYEEEFSCNGEIKRFKGIICLVKLEPFSNGVVLPHEETLSKAKTDRFNLMKATGCNFSQIYSLYNEDENKPIKEIIEKNSKNAPEIEFADNSGVTHRLWSVYDNDTVKNIESEFAAKKLYIADGHHRYETALNYNAFVNNKAEYVMMMLTDMENEGLVVFPTHRIVRGLNDFNAVELIEKCIDYFDVIPAKNRAEAETSLAEAYGKNEKAFIFYNGKGYNLLILKSISSMDDFIPGAGQAYKGLDVSVLHNLILENILGIDKENMAAQINLTYTRSEDEAILAVDNGIANCCFILNPTRVCEIRDVALAGEKMPQKSTYFYPKLITGLIMNKAYSN